MRTVVGIDPGLADTGIGIVRGSEKRIASFSYTHIHTTRVFPIPERLHTIFSTLSRILHKEMPDLMVVEDVFSLEAYPKSGITLGKVAGAVLLAGCQVNVTVMEIPVREAKKTLTGNGKATKEQLERAVRHFVGSSAPIRPYHASDAMALAIIGLSRCTNIGRDPRIDRVS